MKSSKTSILRVLLGEALLLVAALFEWAAINVGGEAFAPHYIAELKRRAIALDEALS